MVLHAGASSGRCDPERIGMLILCIAALFVWALLTDPEDLVWFVVISLYTLHFCDAVLRGGVVYSGVALVQR